MKTNHRRNQIIIAMKIAGKTNKEIAAKYNLEPHYISAIVSRHATQEQREKCLVVTRHNHGKGPKVTNRLFSAAEIMDIRKLHRRHTSIYQLAKDNECSTSTIRRIIRRTTYSDIA